MTSQSLASQYQPAKPEVIVITGPTATGKTALSVRLAKALNTEIISADSQLVYQGLDIGTAKPTLSERDGVPHHLIDVVSPVYEYTVAQYQQDATRVMNRLMAEGMPPVFVGGTGFYLKSVLQAPDEAAAVPPDALFRQQMDARVQEEGPEALYAELLTKDPRRAAMLYPQDTFRVVRALEIIHHTGQPVVDTTEEIISHINARPYNVRWMVLNWDNRERHRALIRERVKTMLDDGWLEEVRALSHQYGVDAYALQRSHGYPVLLEVLAGQRTKDEAIDEISIQVRQYATRQRTWFTRQLRHEPCVRYFDVDNGLDLVWDKIQHAITGSP